MKTFLRGALVYLPTGVKLYKLSDGDAVLRYKTVSKPMNVLFVERRDRGYYTVIYEGENWHVPSIDVYPYKKREMNNEY
jgi:hypothetical protein